MEVTLAGGLVIDLATNDDLAAHHRRLEELAAKRPRGKYYAITAAGVTTAGFSAPAAGLGITVPFTPAGPAGGRLWFVEWLAVWVGDNPAAGAVANVFATVCVGRASIGPGAPIATSVKPNSSDVVVPALTVPASVGVPDKTVVKSQLQLYVLLQGSGLAANTAYNATAGVIDVPDDEEVFFW